MNKRRRILRYWQRHAEKLAEVPKEAKVVMNPQSKLKVQIADPGAKSMTQKQQTQFQLSTTSLAGKTMLTKTEATRFDTRLDDALETESIISYVSTAFGIDGDRVSLPPPPPAASKGSEFLCPYCNVVCPGRIGKDRAWSGHILQDLQPYICTYEKCEDGNRLFNSRRAWLEHERLGHRRVWQCFQHAEPIFRSKAALQCHLESEHSADITETQILYLIEVSESSIAEARTTCPFCLFEGPFPQGFDKHVAFHMQSYAVFSAPRHTQTQEDDGDVKDTQSARAQDLGSEDSWSASDSLRFDSQPPSDATPDADKQAFQSPPASLWEEPITSNPQPKVVSLSIKDFEIVKPISKGAFASVYLSKMKSTGEYIAIKVLKVENLVVKNLIKLDKESGRGVMQPLHTDFVAKLYWTFFSKEYVYLVLEYLNGGDCASLIKVLGSLPEDWCKRYFSELVLGVQGLHSLGIVHRALAPDNILINKNGFLKLTDFGLSRTGIVERQMVEGAVPAQKAERSPDPSSTVSAMDRPTTPTSSAIPLPAELSDPDVSTPRSVRTLDYFAPEILRGVEEGESSDWWSLGCILFEFLYGYTPFQAESPEETSYNILNRRIHWPLKEEYVVSPEVDDLMNKLLCIDPAVRLGANTDKMFPNGGEEIKHHCWFADVDWEHLFDTEVPFIPAPENLEDTGYFETRGVSLQDLPTELKD
jgi:serine/threonine protein kinase